MYREVEGQGEATTVVLHQMRQWSSDKYVYLSDTGDTLSSLLPLEGEGSLHQQQLANAVNSNREWRESVDSEWQGGNAGNITRNKQILSVWG